MNIFLWLLVQCVCSDLSLCWPCLTPAQLTPATGTLLMLSLLLGLMVPPLFDYVVNFCLSFDSQLKQFIQELFLTAVPVSVSDNREPLPWGTLQSYKFAFKCLFGKQKAPQAHRLPVLFNSESPQFLAIVGAAYTFVKWVNKQMGRWADG